MKQFDSEVSRGERFQFGKNWVNFLKTFNDSRLKIAEESLKDRLELQSFENRNFIDIGCGSGIFSLAARRLGAQVLSIDYDPQSVGCAEELKRRFFPGDPKWTIEEKSVLDKNYINSLGQFDIVYSWGVLHHTGSMWEALENAAGLVQPNGILLLSIYNDQGGWSSRWRKIKSIYQKLPSFLKIPYMLCIMIPRDLRFLMDPLLLLRPWMLLRAVKNYYNSWVHYENNRGMNRWYDLVDWIGGYPFEVAKPEEIFNFYKDRGFILQRLKTCGGGIGCNEFVFKKV